MVEVWRNTVTTKSDFAREYADYVAMAASLGWITTRIAGEVFGRQWTVTAKGMGALNEIYQIDTQEDDEDEASRDSKIVNGPLYAGRK